MKPYLNLNLIKIVLSFMMNAGKPVSLHWHCQIDGDRFTFLFLIFWFWNFNWISAIINGDNNDILSVLREKAYFSNVIGLVSMHLL